jgi:probable rRNA maturation factor
VSSGKILFFVEEINFQLKDKRKIRNWIRSCIAEEHQSFDTIGFIFCSDSYLTGLNIRYLGHHSLTDILTFAYPDASPAISGDIFISIERVKDNGERYKTGFINELHRVMIHGILHLCGYDDTSKSDKSVMRRKEDYYLSLLPHFL